MPSQKATMSIAANQVRIEQPDVITIIDYNKDHFTLMNPTKQFFWSGTTDEFVREMTRTRDADAAREDRLAHRSEAKNKAEAAAADAAPKPIDVSKLPPVSITPVRACRRRSPATTPQKYEVQVNGDLFEEIWVAPLDMSADLNPDRFNRAAAEDQRRDAGQVGRRSTTRSTGTTSTASCSDKALMLKIVTHHLAGSFERTATSVKQARRPGVDVQVPDSYRKVRLSRPARCRRPPQPAAESPPSSAIKKGN